MHCKMLIILSILLAILSDRLTAQELRPLDLVIPPFDAVDLPKADATIYPGDTERQELPQEAVDFLRGVALLLIPHQFEDDDRWGEETKIQSGLNMRFDDGQLKTSRRWKHVNHGNWQRGAGTLVDPEERFHLSAARLADPAEDTHRYCIDVSTRLRVTGRQQQWSYGVMLWSVSAEAVVEVNLHLVLDVKSEVVQNDQGSRLRFLPKVTVAEATLTDFSLRRISHLKGKPVQEFGDVFVKLIRRRIDRENKTLAARINTALEEKPERLEIPLDIAGWFGNSDVVTGTEE